MKNQSGYSLIETMVCISLLGLLIFLSTSVYTRFFSNHKMLLRNEALFMANQEITNTINKRIFTDTSYKSINCNMLLDRKISDMDNCKKIIVVVRSVQLEKELVTLSALIRK